MNVYIKTYGCQMNERDSESAAAMLAASGHRIVDSEDEADIITGLSTPRMRPTSSS